MAHSESTDSVSIYVSGEQYVIVMDALGCKCISTFVYNVVVSIDENSFGFQIGPNPADEWCNISGIHIPMEILVFDVVGNLVLHDYISSSGYAISTAQWVNGLYSIVLSNEKYSNITRMLVQH
ncbi:MAG: hypothetical protein IPP69_11950 [Flavobacteriales bacterium]|nr:hypothetical protein [Flavobacteriales bacterium]